jgi:uncharacterized membrane protein (UPF0127 family)
MLRLAVLMLLCGCSSAAKLPTGSLTLQGHKLTVEVAATGVERQQGLMYRDHLAANRGMIFVYPDVAIRHFWMKDTRVPLSIAFADAKGKVLKIADMRPLNTDHTSSLYPVKYALEVNEGWFDEHEIKKGVVLEGLAELPMPESGVN